MLTEKVVDFSDLALVVPVKSDVEADVENSVACFVAMLLCEEDKEDKEGEKLGSVVNE